MSDASMIPIIQESERVLREAIRHFGLKTDPSSIVVTVQSRGRKQAIGWFWSKRWQNGSESAINEINLSAECLKRHNMGETLLHELCHAENATLKVNDCAGRVHNKHFKEMAETIGLEVKPRDPCVGYGYTDLGPKAKAFLKSITFKHEVFAMARVERGPRKKVGSRLVKLQCPECGYVIRSTAKWIATGLPTCTCGCEFSEVE